MWVQIKKLFQYGSHWLQMWSFVNINQYTISDLNANVYQFESNDNIEQMILKFLKSRKSLID